MVYENNVRMDLCEWKTIIQQLRLFCFPGLLITEHLEVDVFMEYSDPHSLFDLWADVSNIKHWLLLVFGVFIIYLHLQKPVLPIDLISHLFI